MAITAEDTKFHKPANSDPEWAETNYFAFQVEQEAIYVLVYTLSRPNLGVMMAHVIAYQGFNPAPMDAFFFDYRTHISIPKKLEDYTLPMGLSVKAVNAPMEYRIDHVGYDEDTEFHLDLKGLSEPYDIADPEMDPITKRIKGEDPKSWAVNAYKNHFDQAVHVTGEAQLLGKKHEIDCVTTMDHSWGVRPELGVPNMAWSQAHWGPDLAFKWISYLDPLNSERVGPLFHGYCVENGKLYGLVSGEGTTKRDGLFPMEIEMNFEDVRGKKHHFTGQSVATYPWCPWPNMMNYCGFLKWDYEGRIGWGETQDCLAMNYVVKGNRSAA